MTNLEKLLADAKATRVSNAREWVEKWRLSHAACDCESDSCIHDKATWAWASIGTPDEVVMALKEREEALASALLVAERALRIVDDAVKEGHDTVADILDHLLSSVEPARAALAEIAKLTGGPDAD